MDYAQGNYAAQNLAQAGTKLAGAPATRETVQGVVIDVGRQVERLAKLSEHLRMMADKVEGARPEPVGKDPNDAAIPHCLVADLRQRNVALSSLLNNCEEQAMRLTAALGIQL